MGARVKNENQSKTIFQHRLDDYLPLVEFAYNNSYYSSIGMAPYEALYNRKCRSPICWDEVGEKKLLGPKIVQITVDKIKLIQRRMWVAQSRQKRYVGKKRRKLGFEVCDHVFLKVSPWKGIARFGKKGKSKICGTVWDPREGWSSCVPVSLASGFIQDSWRIPCFDIEKVHSPSFSCVEAYFYANSRKLDIRRSSRRNLGSERESSHTKIVALVKVLWRNHAME